MKNKKSILLVVLLLAVGFAAVSTTLYINGSTNINPNQDDFKVYYSDAYVNGVEDKSVITDDTHIVFETELSTLSEKYVLDYEVTNGSKNYDAELEMVCTSSNEYLSVTNEFDDESILEALKTRKGKLTLELIKSYAGDEDLSVTIECAIDANATEREMLAEEAIVLKPGDSLELAHVNYYVISETPSTLSLIAADNLDATYEISDDYVTPVFSNSNGWTASPGPYDINIFAYEGELQEYLTGYKRHIESSLNVAIDVRLPSMNDFKELGCATTSNYGFDSSVNSEGCKNSEFAEWIITGKHHWTSSAKNDSKIHIWVFSNDGGWSYTGHMTKSGVRPVITIQKTSLDKLI